MLDVSTILTDPELGGTHFYVSRAKYNREMGEVVPASVSGYHAAGSIQPASSEDLQLFPEEERSEDMIIILSRFRFSLGEPDGSSFTSADIVTWQGSDYRVIKVKNWSTQGGYCKAWAVRQRDQKK